MDYCHLNIPSELKPAERVLTSSAHLNNLLQQLHNHEVLTGQIRELLPASLAPHVQAAIQDTKLILMASSPAWASKLRFIAPNLRNEFPHIQEIRILVIPVTPADPPAPKPPPRRLSPENAERLRNLASKLNDSRLSAALLKLATHGMK